MRTARSAVLGSKKYAIYDNFDRANGAIGTSTSGHAWTDSGSGVWEIVSNNARQAADTNGGQTSINAPGLNTVTLVKITALGSYVELIARRISSTLLLIAAVDASGNALLLREATTLATVSAGFAVGDTLGLYVKGPVVKLLKNGVPVITATDYVRGDGLGVGMRNGIGGAVGTKTYDLFRVLYPI